jgi:hypothetical protein
MTTFKVCKSREAVGFYVIYSSKEQGKIHFSNIAYIKVKGKMF